MEAFSQLHTLRYRRLELNFWMMNDTKVYVDLISMKRGVNDEPIES